MANRTIIAVMQQKQQTCEEWDSENPVLVSGEFGYDTSNKEVKIGDGKTEWSGLHAIGSNRPVLLASIRGVSVSGNGSTLSSAGKSQTKIALSDSLLNYRRVFIKASGTLTGTENIYFGESAVGQTAGVLKIGETLYKPYFWIEGKVYFEDTLSGIKSSNVLKEAMQTITVKGMTESSSFSGNIDIWGIR